MTDEQNQQQIPESKNLTSEQISQSPKSINQNYGAITTESETCQYQGCSTIIDPNNYNIDHIDELKLCKIHSKECENCSEIHSIDRMHKYKANNLSLVKWYCDDCYQEKFFTCPNCKEVKEKDDYIRPTAKNIATLKKGGCNECSTTCQSCNKVIDKDYCHYFDNDSYCEDCYSDHYSSCEGCNDVFERDELFFVEDVGEFCSSCYDDKFTKCKECNNQIKNSDAREINGDDYCEECYATKGSVEYNQVTDNFKDFTYTKKDRYLNLLYKMLPISVKDLKSKQPSIAAGLADLISFSKGKTITLETVNEFRKTLKPEDFKIEYTVWEGVQRSIDTLKDNPVGNKPQLAINVIASAQMLEALKIKPALYDLFDNINTLSKKSTHPYIKDQVGWIRVELDPNGEYILVDEIQSDHSNASFRLKNSTNDHEITDIRNAIKYKYQLDDEQLNKLLIEYSTIIKDFPNIASQAVVKFANKNNFKKIFWHTYDSGMKLKENEPPRSLYDKTPKENFFHPSQNKPFGLDGEFFEKEAKNAKHLYKIARRIYFNYLARN